MVSALELMENAGLYAKSKIDRAYYHACGGDARPVFYDIDRTYPALRVIDRNYDLIRDELLAVLPRRGGMPRYHDVDRRQQAISETTPGNWHTLFLSVYGAGERLPTRQLCPRTVEVVESIPNLIQTFFSILDPGKKVPAHKGPHFFYLRYHTAFLVPREKPPTIRVKDRFYTWRERESLLFDDSWNHEVLNESDEVRVVLITDIIRPRPAYLGPLLRLALNVSLSGVRKRSWEKYFERVVIR
jgi:aspartyl/asparaginyl beta-hydroxylase (cupin superfamily)